MTGTVSTTHDAYLRREATFEASITAADRVIAEYQAAGRRRPRTVRVMVPFLPTTYLSPNRGERKEGRVPALIVESKRAMRGAWALWLLGPSQL